MMMSFVIGGPTQQPPALPRNLTQSLGLPNYTSQYGSGLAQDLRGQLFLFTGNPAASPLIETMAYSQIPNFTMPVSQFNPNNPLNTSIDSLYNAPLLQNGVLGGGMFQGNGSTVGGGQTGSIFAPQQSTQQGFPTFPPQQQQGGTQQVPQQQQGAGNAPTLGQVISGLQQQISQIMSVLQSLFQGGGATQPPQQQPPQPGYGFPPPPQQQQGYAYQSQPQTGIQSLVSPVANGLSQQQSNLNSLISPNTLSQYTSPVDLGGSQQGNQLQALMNPQVLQGNSSPIVNGQIQTAPPAGQGFANPTMQGYGTQGAAPQGFGYGNASPVMQGYGMPPQQQQQQYNPYAAQGGYPPYATAGGQIIYG